ncbi:DNA/RNA non-specific endonuclease [Bordetella trematum]|uniref:DNA/RNA non-specific endonuclease n=1 Tax=Bordetella trematum TaxID=123899 RepID=UPI003D0D26DA
MTRQKKTVSRPRSRRPAAKASPDRHLRFLRALLVSTLTSFGVATCALHPQTPLPASVSQVVDQVRQWIPGQDESLAPSAVPAPSGLAQTRFADCPQFFPQGGMPQVPGGAAQRELCLSGFAILHNGQTKTPVFVVERLNRRLLAQGKGLPRTDRFYAEARLPSAERAVLSDYKNSGYSRGHMAPAGDMYDAQTMAQSFSLANMVPQDQRHNAGAWSRIEQDTRKYIQRAQGDVYVFTGPVYEGSPKTIGNGVAVPTHLFKVVHDPVAAKTWVHWHANRPDTQVGPPISYAEFVRRTGLYLLPKG